MIEIVHTPINVHEVQQSVADTSAGAICLFVGTTRNHAEGKAVRWLEYEAYEPMARATMEKIAVEAQQRWAPCRIAVVHRLGRVEIGEVSIAIAVSTPHRKEAFEVCRFLIDTIKRDVPIWKHEVYEETGAWVHPKGMPEGEN